MRFQEVSRLRGILSVTANPSVLTVTPQEGNASRALGLEDKPGAMALFASGS